MNDCIFCKIVKKQLPSEVIHESENFFSVLDIDQNVKGHTLIIPKKHFTNLIDMPATLGRELLEEIKYLAGKNLKNGSEGFNIIINNFKAAGQLVMHAHIHLIPRKNADNAKINLA